ncbi:DUF2911 domain-containing protein [Marinoscillum sp. MHG1-6]|uniref:DUF2911 domain-containing protein n=1 Tax=Marinoscillum sp. MHG1-6 TaxID=2959627 RepID=UPI0021589EE8|nr:DUF2911 domain-containing protein [Marinoscillum sp. MHG1-6]
MQNLKLLTLIAFLYSFSGFSQIQTPSASPEATLIQKVGVTTVTIEYSRPGVKGRTIFGELVKYDEHWRTGANDATKISFDGDVTLGGVELSAGDYVILTQPGKNDWTINLYAFDGSGVGGYTKKEPVGSFTSKPVSISDQVESFTIDINNLRNSTATIDLIWDKTKVSLPLDVKTDEKVMATINSYDESSMRQQANDYHGMASYLLSENKELDKALEFETKAAQLRPDAYWILRTRALILAELGKYKKAIKSAEESIEYAEKAGSNYYVEQNRASIKKWKKAK